MSTPGVQMLQQRYQELRRLRQAGKLDSRAFYAEVARLQFQDASGTWWTVDPERGSLLRFAEGKWIPATPPGARPPASAPSRRPPAAANWRSVLGLLLAFVLPIGTAFVWFIWGALHPIAESGIDCLTPMILAGVPIGLLILHRPIDRVLRPLEPIRRLFPRPILAGAALGMPVVMGLVCSSLTSAGFGAARLTLIVSMLTAHVLLRRPEVSR